MSRRDSVFVRWGMPGPRAIIGLMEHRWGERLQVDFPVRVTTHRYWVRHGRLADLSVSGALLEADFEARVLARIQVAIFLPLRPTHEAPVVEAYVARRSKRMFGIEWCVFAPPAVSELLREVAHRPLTPLRRHEASASQALSRLSAPLLKHGT